MRYFLSRCKWYFHMLWMFAKMSMLSQLEYRLNFIAFSAVELGYMIIKLLYLVIVMHTGVTISSLTPDMVMMFIGTYIFMTGIWMMFRGINELPYKVLHGEMDLLMTKPGSLQFLQTFGQFNFGLTIPNVLAGLILIVISWRRVHIPVTLINIAGFTLYLMLGIILTYGFILIPTLLIFWVTSIGGVSNMIIATWELNNMPMQLYNKYLRAAGTYLLPIFLITNWPGQFLFRQLSLLESVWGVFFPLLLLVLSRIMWKQAFRRYTSANG